MKQRKDTRKTSFGYRFAMLHRLQMAMCRKDIQTQGLQPSQLPFVISLVHEDGPVTQGYLSEHLVIDKGTTARAIQQLEKKGFVSRRINPANRRQNLVSATEKAHAAADRLVATLTDAAESIVKGFSDQEKKLVLDFMDRMLVNAQETVNQIHESNKSI
ncbi:MAG: MarR family transcriptional regulator [Proteobacteria bacterium]|nr:MarR family transcriptional regulator [Pseudomonadota bacterium]